MLSVAAILSCYFSYQIKLERLMCVRELANLVCHTLPVNKINKK